jgi:uncharacterized membrane protein YbaN (DUF454 family)
VTLLFYLRHARTGGLLPLLLSAAAVSIAPWAKQTCVVAMGIVPLILLLRRQFRPLIIYVSAVAAFSGILLALACWEFRADRLYLWLIDIPSRRGYKSVWSTDLDLSNRYLLLACLPAFAVIGARLWALSLEIKGAWTKLLDRTWVLFAMTGVIFWPICVLTYSKLGAADNALLYTGYFVYAAAGLIAFEILTEQPTASRQYQVVIGTVWVAVFVLMVPLSVTLAKTILRPHRFDSPSQTVFEFSRQHPGEVYFPWFPLTVYLGEGKLYHSEGGLGEHIDAHIPTDRDNLMAYLPPHLKYVAYRGAVPGSVLYFMPEFSERVDYPGLPGWTVLTRKSPVSNQP